MKITKLTQRATSKVIMAAGCTCNTCTCSTCCWGGDGGDGGDTTIEAPSLA